MHDGLAFGNEASDHKCGTGTNIWHPHLATDEFIHATHRGFVAIDRNRCAEATELFDVSEATREERLSHRTLATAHAQHRQKQWFVVSRDARIRLGDEVDCPQALV